MRIPRFLAISKAGARPGPEWHRWCEDLAAAGVDGLQVRRQDAGDREVLALAAAARKAFPAPGVLLVNRRPDIALSAHADGVQLPASGLPTAAVRRTFSTRLLVGRSTHSLAEVERARDEGADFALFGPVFATPSKAGRIAARGVAALADAAACGLPVLALGGVDETNARQVVASGAWGFAAIRWLQDPGAARPLLADLRLSWSEA